MNIKLTDYISPNFHNLINPVLNNEIRELMLTGGRGSTKSSFASLMIVYGMMEDYYLRNIISNSVVVRKVANTISQSVYAQIKWAINTLKVSHLWHCTKSPFQCTFRPSGQMIIFVGCDDPLKIKSLKFEQGYSKYRWYEEYNQFDGLEEIRSLNWSLARGGDCLGIYSYNPDPDQDDWANVEAEGEEIQNVEKRFRHHSDYLTVPSAWLGEDFMRQAEDLKVRHPSAYKNELLGLVTGIGGNIFKNVKYKSFDEITINNFDRIRQGLDFGFTVDPCAFNKICFIRDKKEINAFNEIYEYELSTSALSDLIKKMYNKHEVIKGDSQEQRTIDTMIFEYDVNIIGCEKGPDSVRHGIKYLQDLNSIYIDKKRCPNTWREFKNYQYEKDKKTGKFINKYPDKNNHSIDSIRYAMDDVILNDQWRLR